MLVQLLRETGGMSAHWAQQGLKQHLAETANKHPLDIGQIVVSRVTIDFSTEFTAAIGCSWLEGDNSFLVVSQLSGNEVQVTLDLQPFRTI